MLHRSLGAWAALLAVACGQSTSQSTTSRPPTTSTSSATGHATHTVQVGYSGFKFSPDQITADAGDIVEFRFYPPDHSVIRGDFNHACIPYEITGENRQGQGFYSGVQYLSGISADPPKFSVQVNNTEEPIFFYCGAKGSCTQQHMVGVINPNSTWTLAAHIQNVEAAEFELLPGQDWPSEHNPTASGTGAAPSPTAGADTSKNDSGSSSSAHLNAGQIAGIAIGGAAVLILAAGLIYLFGRRGGLHRAYRDSQPMFHSAPGGVGGAAAMMAERKYSPTLTSTGPGGSVYGGPDRGLGSPPMGFTQTPPLSPGYTYAGSAVPGSEGSYHDPRLHSHSTSPLQPLQPPQSPPPAPVELPASSDQGNSPLPAYKHFSWARGSESNYRPSKPDNPPL